MTDDKRSENLVGRQLGDYKLKSLLAEGGMARIYRAIDVELEREVAIKVLLSGMVDSDNTVILTATLVSLYRNSTATIRATVRGTGDAFSQEHYDAASSGNASAENAAAERVQRF